jgi:hypothetical protein
MTSNRLDIRGILRDPSLAPDLHARAVAGILSRLTHTPHTIAMSAPYSIDVDGTEYIRADAVNNPAHCIQTAQDYETRHRSFELMQRHGGGFCQRLAAAWFAADTGNKARIEAAFPDYLAEYGPESEFWGK